MKKYYYVFPGSFCPPTYGHFFILKEAAKLFGHIIIACSDNPDKKNNHWFTPDECKAMWQTYNLPKNIEILTLSELKKRIKDTSRIVMIRGIRDSRDMEYEKKVMSLNKNNFGINKYFYIFSEKENCDISSSTAKKMAQNLEIEKLYRYVSPGIVSILLERILKAKNIFMVAARPACGKSTFLRILEELNEKNIFINTDEFNKKLRPILERAFIEKDLIEMTLNHEDQIEAVIKNSWFSLLKNALNDCPEGANIFIEIPYGLKENKMMFRFIGSRIIYINCDEDKLIDRVIKRGTPEHIPFIKNIPDFSKTKKICKKYKLNLTVIDANGTLEDLEKEAKKLNTKLNGG